MALASDSLKRETYYWKHNSKRLSLSQHTREKVICLLFAQSITCLINFFDPAFCYEMI